ncbi:TonB-dependent receptor [Steroidobacter flavus]|uniref:TonB-dependent receptor n=1 Tax=Steroidobacter flavus TaxID=1842136 RepID=A0ABV8T659_9GAMM
MILRQRFLTYLAALAAMTSANAQQAMDATANLEEITVTARRRSETLQDVPIAVTVMTSQDIARAGIVSVQDFANLTPNVTFDNALNLGTNYLSIRGQSQAQYSPPPAAIVVDGVLNISPMQFNVDEFDLQQVEVLKGPQGAIYGRNAIAGAINLTTAKPGPEFGAHALASFGSADEWIGKGSMSGPVIPDLLYVLGGVSYTDRRGQVRNATTGGYSDKYEDVTSRLRVVLTPADNVEADIKYTYSDAEGHDPAYVWSRSGDPAISSDPFDANRIGNNPRKLHDLSGRLTWDTRLATTTLTLAYVDVTEGLAEDLDMTSDDILAATQHEEQKGFSQELRFASATGSNLSWLIGGYHVRSNQRRVTNIYVDPFFFGLAPVATQADALFSANSDLNRYETWAGFGQVQYDFTARLGVELALRYDDDELHQMPGAGAERAASFSKWQPKATAIYKPSTDLSFYVSVGQGFRSGDFNASGSSFGNPVILAETATNYEIGAKTRLLDRAMTINAAIFQTDLDNGQFKLFDTVGATNVGVNIDETRIRGFEIEGALRAMQVLDIRASFGYTDPEIRAFTPPPGFTGEARTYIGNRPPRIAKVTANLGFDLHLPISNGLTLFFRPGYRYESGPYWDPENVYRRPDRDLINLRAGVRDSDERWSVTGWGRNVLNEKVTADYQPYTNSGHPLGNDLYYPPVGSSYGIELTVRY